MEVGGCGVQGINKIQTFKSFTRVKQEPDMILSLTIDSYSPFLQLEGAGSLHHVRVQGGERRGGGEGAAEAAAGGATEEEPGVESKVID